MVSPTALSVFFMRMTGSAVMTTRSAGTPISASSAAERSSRTTMPSARLSARAVARRSASFSIGPMPCE